MRAYRILVLKLLIAILDRVMYPNSLDPTRDKRHQQYLSRAIDWIDKQEE